MQQQPEYVCEAHKQKIINTLETANELALLCQICMDEQQKPLDKFLQEYNILIEKTKPILKSSQQDREARLKLLKLIVIKFKEEIITDFDILVTQIDSYFKKSQHQSQKQLESFSDLEIQNIAKNYFKLKEDTKLSIELEKSKQDDRFKDMILKSFSQTLKKTESWPEQFDKLWNDRKSQPISNIDEDFQVNTESQFYQSGTQFGARTLVRIRPGTAGDRNLPLINPQSQIRNGSNQFPGVFQGARLP